MLRRLARVFDTMKVLQTPMLGRWCITGNRKNNWKIDMANTDHCGTCVYMPQKKPVAVVEKTTSNLEPNAANKPKN